MGNPFTGAGMGYPHEPDDRSSSGAEFSLAFKTLASNGFFAQLGVTRRVVDSWQRIATPAAIPFVEQLLCEIFTREPPFSANPFQDIKMFSGFGRAASDLFAAADTEYNSCSSGPTESGVPVAVPSAVALVDDLVEYSPTILMDKGYSSTSSSKAAKVLHTTNFGGGATPQRPFKAAMQMVLAEAENGRIWAPLHTTVTGQRTAEQDPLMGAALTPLDTG